MGITLNTRTIETVCRSAAPTGKQARQEPFDNLVTCMKKHTTTESEMRQAIKDFHNERSMSWPHCIIDSLFNKGKMQEARKILINIEVGSAYQKAAVEAKDSGGECVSEATVYRAMDPDSMASNRPYDDECILAQRNANDVEALYLMAQSPDELTNIFVVSEEDMHLSPKLTAQETQICFDANISVNWPNSPLDKATFRYSTTDFVRSKFCETYVVKNSDKWIAKFKGIINSLAVNHGTTCKSYQSSTTQLTDAKCRLATAKKDAQEQYTHTISLLEMTDIFPVDWGKARYSTERYKTLAEAVDTLTQEVNSKEQTCLDKATESKFTAETLNKALWDYNSLTRVLSRVLSRVRDIEGKSYDEIKVNGGGFFGERVVALQRTATGKIAPSIICGFDAGIQTIPSELTVSFLCAQMGAELKRSTNSVSEHTDALHSNETWTKRRGSHAMAATGILSAINELEESISDYNNSGEKLLTRINKAINAITLTGHTVTSASELELKIMGITAASVQKSMKSTLMTQQPITSPGSYVIKGNTSKERANTASQAANLKDLAMQYISKYSTAEQLVKSAESDVNEVNAAAKTARHNAEQMHAAQRKLQEAMIPYNERAHIVTHTNQPEVINGDVSHQPQTEDKFKSAITQLDEMYNKVRQNFANLAATKAQSLEVGAVISQLTPQISTEKIELDLRTAIGTSIWRA